MNTPEDIYLKIVRSAVKSPSGHNTQPWFFSKTDNGILIKPDYHKTLSEADPMNRELFISLGCAAETSMIAAQFYGFKPLLKINASGPDSSIEITLQKDDAIEKPDLFSYITTRQTTRNLYDKKSIPDEDMNDLKTIFSEINVNIRYFSLESDIQLLIPFITNANNIQMQNSKFKSELIQWMRFSEKEALLKGDGLFTACNGIPSMGRLLGSFVLKNFVTAQSENRRLHQQLEKSAAIAMFKSTNDTIEDWVFTGMTFQRFALTLTKMDINYSFLNAPCQIEEVRKQMITELKLDKTFPQLIIRLGFSKRMPYSLRRTIINI